MHGLPASENSAKNIKEQEHHSKMPDNFNVLMDLILKSLHKISRADFHLSLSSAKKKKSFSLSLKRVLNPYACIL